MDVLVVPEVFDPPPLQEERRQARRARRKMRRIEGLRVLGSDREQDPVGVALEADPSLRSG